MTSILNNMTKKELIEKIKLLIKQTKVEMKQDQEDYDAETAEDNFAVGYIRGLELKIDDLKDLLKDNK